MGFGGALPRGVAILKRRNLHMACHGWTILSRGVMSAEQLVRRVSLAIPKPIRRHVIILHDVTAAAVSLPLAAFLRFGSSDLPQQTISALLPLVPLFIVLFLGFSLSSRTHLAVWCHSSVQDFRTLAGTVTASIAILFAIAYTQWDRGAIPWSLPIIQWLGLLAALAGSRVVYRLLNGGGLTTPVLRSEGSIPHGSTIVVGSDESTARFLRALGHSLPGMEAVGILEPDTVTIGRRILGVPVLGQVEALPKILTDFAHARRAITSIVLTGSPSASLMKRIVDQASAARIAVFRAPDPLTFRDAGACPIELRPIAIQDLLGRPQALPDLGAMAAFLTGKSVLVTGAGGSIGSELVRQIASYCPDQLVLLDSCEFNLYQIDRELAERFPNLPREAVLCDVRQRDQLVAVFTACRPTLVFHAAALKHVPMVELNPCEGMLTNAIGSRNVADAALACGAQAMVQISTDKAINPTSMMGVSKRLAEFYCQALDCTVPEVGWHHCRFMTVRFGNVLGSSGSVVPLFQRQLERGGPLTVTHPDINRYFMTINEAVALILQASAYGVSDEENRGQIFVLDMGEPLRVADLARQMIRLAGLVPDEDVTIEFVGLRPGEKLFEELFDISERRLPSPVPGVLVATSRHVNLHELRETLDIVQQASYRRDAAAVCRAAQHLIPRYRTAMVSGPDRAAPSPGAGSGPRQRPNLQATVGCPAGVAILLGQAGA
jgi:FlaA1/EpsC-like NDP-sugar epimerase